ncbi:MAG TPA: exodeoxyribonuclease VII large subunit, partial [Thermoanaerobaculia bacterium]|nr:exodeoxyribonuclease VII large subunit [Thermoanaerobaculia bacterium]
AVFDSRRIAEAIALCPFPVLTGLGHEIDQAIADLVAHTAAKTPTKAAELLIERVRRAEESLVEVRRALLREALEPLRRGRVALGRAERGVELARLRMGAAGARLDEYARAFGRLGRGALRQAGKDRAELASRLAAAALRGVERGAGERVRLAERLAGSARARVREARAGLEGRARLCAELAPERTLARGFSITRDRAGRLLRHPAQAAAGDRITTRVAGGELSSRVEEP